MKLKTCLLAVSVACLALTAGAEAETLRLMTGPQGGTWVPLGGQLKATWEKAVPGLSIQALPGAGIANVKAIEAGKAEVAFANTISTVDAVNGAPPFDGKAKNICHIASLYPQYFQVVTLADAGIGSVTDIKGQAMATQPRGNTAEQITRHMLEANGLSYDDLGKVNFMSYTDAVGLLKDGHAQVFTLGTTIPASAIQDLAAARDIKLLAVDDATVQGMKKLNAGYTVGTIKAGTYSKQGEDVRVITYATHIIASCQLPEDEVYAMTKAMHGSIADMAAINAAMKDLTPQQMAQDIGVPMHPGAEKYFKEIGAL